MFRRYQFAGVLLGALLLGAGALAAPSNISLSPEVNVGRVVGKPELSQYQADLRCDPTDARRLMISAKIKTTPIESERETGLFSSRDGGATWDFTSLPQSGDPDVAFDERGVAHWSFISLSRKNGPIGYKRSTDGGITWSNTRELGAALDHPHIVCAPKNRVFITGRAFSGSVQVLRSVDGGNTFDVVKTDLPGALNEGFVYGTAVLSDGTLLVPYMSANTILADARNRYAGNVRSIHCLRLKPGSAAFDAPVFIAPQIDSPDDGLGAATVLGDFAVGRWKGKERVYLSFARPRSGKPALPMITTSDDGGLSWSPPRAIAPDAPVGAGAGSSCVMVNRDGVVGVSWFSMEASQNFDIFFCASTDGGQTFAPPVRVSPASSHEPRVEARYPGQDQVYSSASPDGSFRLVWTDARNNAPGYQVFTRAATVSPLHVGAKAKLKVVKGFGAGTYEAGARVAITAMAPPKGQEFDHWSSSNSEPVEEAAQPSAVVTPGEGKTTFTAHYRPQKKWKLTVSGGTGSGMYVVGTLVPLRAATPPTGQKFSTWSGPDRVGFTFPRDLETRVLMPARDVSVAPVYEIK